MSCQIDGADLGASLDFFGSPIRKAKKAYKCCECLREIKAGESYQNATGKYDGEFFEEKTCAICAEIRCKLFCSWYYGEMWEQLREESVFTLSLVGLSEAAIDELNKFWKENANHD